MSDDRGLYVEVLPTGGIVGQVPGAHVLPRDEALDVFRGVALIAREPTVIELHGRLAVSSTTAIK